MEGAIMGERDGGREGEVDGCSDSEGLLEGRWDVDGLMVGVDEGMEDGAYEMVGGMLGAADMLGMVDDTLVG